LNPRSGCWPNNFTYFIVIYLHILQLKDDKEYAIVGDTKGPLGWGPQQ